MLKRPDSNDFEPHTPLNIFILIVGSATNLSLLWLCAHASDWKFKLVYAFCFSFTNNTLFSLVHESVHRVFSRTPWINELGGILASAWHPTGLIFQRVCHLGHHLRNRTDHEIFDMYYENDNKILKYLQFYGIFTGFYWLTLATGCFLYALSPSFFRFSEIRGRWTRNADFAMLKPLIQHPQKRRIRLEILYSFSFQFAVFHLLQLDFASWLLCYWIFGMNWGSLQYADHAWSVRDIRNGAWNLKVLPWTQLIYLNYHLHLVHHRFPTLPWHRLPKYLDPQEPKPLFWKIYFQMWKGPRPVNGPSPKPAERELEEMLQ